MVYRIFRGGLVKEINYTTTRGQKEVYCLLLNYDNPRFPRTQAEVCDMLDISKSTCSDRVKRLIELDYIAELDRTEVGIHYRKGRKCRVIETQIQAESMGSGRWFDQYGQAIRPPDGSEPYRPLYRLHLNGGWIKFSVAVEGRLDYIVKDPDNPDNKLFGDSDPYHMPGSINWYGRFKFNEVLFSIRYQRTKRGNKYLYVQPGSLIIDASEVTPDKDVITPFLDQCRPLLHYLEQYAEWFFKHTQNGDYLVEASVRRGTVGTKEYGLDEFLTGVIKDFTGDIGIPGVSNFWTDKSPSAMGGDGEAEFNKASYAHAIEQLPVTLAKVERLENIREENRV
ncbi:MAG: winged helix-turn-helix domain-containing protein, partial [Candidatus Methanoplasma sp.]|nr:winged helix-turn-helix domain-containing protein [Candidatus Methanoplasma sp.]